MTLSAYLKELRDHCAAQKQAQQRPEHVPAQLTDEQCAAVDETSEPAPETN